MIVRIHFTKDFHLVVEFEHHIMYELSYVCRQQMLGTPDSNKEQYIYSCFNYILKKLVKFLQDCPRPIFTVTTGSQSVLLKSGPISIVHLA